MFLACQANYGYHFDKWSDGNRSQQRSFILTKDTTFTAEFEKNTYTISTASSNPEWGTTAGATKALYLDEVEVSATPNYGYHFTQWSDGVTDNPRTIVLTSDTTFTAEFEKNTYTLSLTTNNPVMGQVEGAGVYGYNTQVNCVAVPYDGYEFVSWDNGIKDNPYILTITEDITLIAMFQPIGEGLFDTKEQASSPRKVLHNGQILILRGEKVYTITGQEVK